MSNVGYDFWFGLKEKSNSKSTFVVLYNLKRKRRWIRSKAVVAIDLQLVLTKSHKTFLFFAFISCSKNWSRICSGFRLWYLNLVLISFLMYITSTGLAMIGWKFFDSNDSLTWYSAKWLKNCRVDNLWGRILDLELILAVSIRKWGGFEVGLMCRNVSLMKWVNTRILKSRLVKVIEWISTVLWEDSTWAW